MYVLIFVCQLSTVLKAQEMFEFSDYESDTLPAALRRHPLKCLNFTEIVLGAVLKLNPTLLFVKHLCIHCLI